MVSVKKIRLILGNFVESIEDSRLQELAHFESQQIPQPYQAHPLLVSYKVASRLLFNLEVNPSGEMGIKKKQSGQELLEYSDHSGDFMNDIHRYETLYYQTLASLKNLSWQPTGNLIKSQSYSWDL